MTDVSDLLIGFRQKPSCIVGAQHPKGAGGEAWIYDGCSEVLRDEAYRRKLYEEHGSPIRRLGYRVSTLHGFTMEEYHTVIRDMLEKTKFKGNYQMALIDIWMKVTLKKFA